jgi:hypothetical protein
VNVEIVKNYFQKKREEFGLTDYEGQAQSEARTKERHRRASEVVRRHDYLVDVGCGTGLFMDTLAKRGNFPDKYHGYDIFADVFPAVANRASKYGIALRMDILSPSDDLAAELFGLKADSLVCTGLMGYGDRSGRPGDFAHPDGVQSIIKTFKQVANRGFVSMPLDHPKILQEELGFHRFSMLEVSHISKSFEVEFWDDLELAIRWG